MNRKINQFVRNDLLRILCVTFVVVAVFSVAIYGFSQAITNSPNENTNVVEKQGTGLSLMFGVPIVFFTAFGMLASIYCINVVVKNSPGGSLLLIRKSIREATVENKKEIPVYILILVWLVSIPILALARYAELSNLDPELVLATLITLSCFIGIASLYRSSRVERSLGTRADFVRGPFGQQSFNQSEISELFVQTTEITKKASRIRVVSGFPVLDAPGSVVSSELLTSSLREAYVEKMLSFQEEGIDRSSFQNNITSWTQSLRPSLDPENDKSIWPHIPEFSSTTKRAAEYYSQLIGRSEQDELRYERVLLSGARIDLMKRDRAVQTVLRMYARKAPMYFRHLVDMVLVAKPSCKLYLAPGFRFSTFLLAGNQTLIWQLNRGDASMEFEKVFDENQDPEIAPVRDPFSSEEEAKLDAGGYLDFDWSTHHSINGLFVIEDASRRIITPFENYYDQCAPRIEVSKDDFRQLLGRQEVFRSYAVVDLVFMNSEKTVVEWYSKFDKLIEC